MDNRNPILNHEDGPVSGMIAGHTIGSATKIGKGEIGGKAQSLIYFERILSAWYDRDAFANIKVEIPRFWVIATDWFDLFMEKNNLYDIAHSDTKDHHKFKAFLSAELPVELVWELRKLIAEIHAPLAIRSSSLLEDAINEPFAGVYCTKMIPNNQFSLESRLRTLREAIKFVYASTFSRNAKSYRRGMGRSHRDEKMAVIIQDIVGLRHGDRFYPNISGVARSNNYYSFGNARPENGVVSLALGLGKTIVSGGKAWTYCPAYPRAKPPFGSVKELLKGTQTQFWAVNMGKIPAVDPLQETEFLFEGNLGHAEEDDVLREIASTFDPQSERINIGVGTQGPRVLDFASLLELDEIPLNDLLKELLITCENALGKPVEIEFAVNFPRGNNEKARFGFLQIRPMFISEDLVEIKEEELTGDSVLIASKQVLGNGQLDSIKDIVFVKPDVFTAKDSWLATAELDEINRTLIEEEQPYLLVVIGRLGSSDPWLGIPVEWGQVSGCRAVIEATTSGMNVEMSQGSHFFHNVACLRVLYFSMDNTGHYPFKWEWLKNQREVIDLQFVRHVALDEPLHIKVDGKSGWGVINH
jgi:hypothetical protein